MKKLITMTLISLPMLFSSNISAEGFNDNYFQVGYSTNNFKFVDEIMELKGSVEIGNDFSILGRYARETGDWRDPGEYETSTYTRTRIGIGKTFEIDTNTDITSSLSYLDYDIKKTRQANGSSTITNTSSKTDSYFASVGVRNLSDSGIQTNLKLNFWRGGKAKSKSNEIELEVMKHFSDTLAIGGRVLRHDAKPASSYKSDWTETGIFVRRSF
ncbi:hypothetical protein N9I58_04435 [Candidatus Thioglobus sp.]|nr:hypothetical protein [Candidatus Thioglobus sp.]